MFTVEGKQNVVLGTAHELCYTCLLAEARKEENRELALSVIRKKMMKPDDKATHLKVLPGTRDFDGNPVIICHDCLQKYAEETADGAED